MNPTSPPLPKLPRHPRPAASRAALALLASLASSTLASAQAPATGSPAKGDVTQAGPGAIDRRERPVLKLAPVSVDFAHQLAGTPSADVEVLLSNTGDEPVTIDSIALAGDEATYTLSHPSAVPFELAAGGVEVLTVGFHPTAEGGHDAQIVVLASDLQFGEIAASLTGFGVGPPGVEVLMNCVGDPYVDTEAQPWITDYGAEGGIGFFVLDPIEQTLDDPLYRTARVGHSFGYEVPVPDGWYEVTLHFAELLHQSDGQRVFDVSVEEQPFLLDLDLFAVAGHDVAHAETVTAQVTDGRLSLDLSASQGEASLSAFEVRATPFLSVSPPSVEFEDVEEGQSAELDLTLANAGGLPLTIESVDVSPFGGDSAAPFSLDFEGEPLGGSSEPVSYAVSRTLAAGEELVVPVTFAPVAHDVFQAYVEFSGPDFAAAGALLHGLAGSGHPFLHVVVTAPEVAVDHDDDGSEEVVLDGTLSHTHEFGHDLVSFEWSEDATPLGSGPMIAPALGVGDHHVTLTIGDDNDPQETLAGSVDVKVAAPDAVPGILARYYDGSETPPGELIDEVPANPDFVELADVWAIANDGTAGGSPFTGNVMVTMEGDVVFEPEGTWVITPSGGTEQRLFVDGSETTKPLFLTAGAHHVEARFAVDSLAGLPLRVQAGLEGQPKAPLDPAETTHDETDLAPFVNSMTSLGSVLGGNPVTIDGVGFFPSDQVVLHWGGSDFTDADFDSITSGKIALTSPPHAAGTVSVTVETPNGTSPAKTYEYTEDGPVPIAFTQAKTYSIADPTTGDWGPDGRFYAASRQGQIKAFTFDESWNAVSSQTYAGVSNDPPANEILGICFDPFADPADPVRIYVARSDLFAQGGSSFPGSAPYDGKLSILEGPDFDVPIDVVTGLPLSNHDHGINGMQFDNNGDLYITVGGNTNAGIQWPTIGDIPASPFSGAILEVELSKPDFDGEIVYVHEETGLSYEHSNDMVYGLEHAVQEGVDVHVHAPGFRNAYDLVYTTGRYLYATDNGPNFSFGPASTGPDTQASDPQEPDELLLVEHGNYYGHPNHNRAEHPGNEREYVYREPDAPKLPSEYTPPLVILPASSDGIVEYRSRSFGGQLRGDLLAQQWGNYLRRIELAPGGRAVESVSELFWTGALDVQTGPGGALLALNYNGDNLKVYTPDDLSLVGLKALDVHPWRAPATGGATFTIGGSGFGDLADTTVTIGGRTAVLESVTPTRIVGTVPAEPDPVNALVDVVVTVDDGEGAADSDTLSKAFFFLGPKGQAPGFWEDRQNMPVGLSDVAAAEIGGLIYVVGDGSPDTYRYNTSTDVWPAAVARRPFVGSHHSAEAFDGRMYLVGGLGGGSEGKVQIYDPATDSWSVGADMPWAGGSVSTALIDGLVYAAGGIVGSTTVDHCAVYDPALDAWTSSTPMPAGEGRNHAAAGTDGERLWIFGGRGVGSGPCDCVANGFDDVHVYDPATDTWESSLDPGSTLAEMPVGRGGTGKALWHQGEFYVMGGETLNGPGATENGVYARVDVYDPETNTWRRDADMLVARQGIYPVLFQGLIHVPGGGVLAGGGASPAMDLLNHQ